MRFSAQNRLTAVGRESASRRKSSSSAARQSPPWRQARAGAKDDAVGGADADGRRAAHDHIANGLGHLGRRLVFEPDLLLGQQALIQQPQRTVPPLDRLDPLGRQQSLSHAHTSR